MPGAGNHEFDGVPSTSPLVRRVLACARHEAGKEGAAAIEPVHVLLGLCRTGDRGALALLARFGLGVEEIRRELAPPHNLSGPIHRTPPLPLAATTHAVLALAAEEARAGTGADALGVGCLVLGLLRQDGEVAQWLRDHGVTLDAARREAMATAAEPVVAGVGSAPTPRLLVEFGRDLTDLARRERFDPLIGRDAELELVIQILCQRWKRNPVLLGDPGVGKTALVEGLAQRIADGRVPAPLADRHVVELDLAGLVAGTRYRGEFEERLAGLLDEIEGLGDRIVFLDEVHTLVGAGAAEGSLDAANILKPRLAQGRLSCIGATTVREYRQVFERDRALDRRFQRVDLPAPTPTEALAIVRGVAGRYELFHGVRYSPRALQAAVHQTVRLQPERQLPDKAIEALDQAGARARLRPHPPGRTPTVTATDVDAVVARQSGVPAARLRLGEAERLRTMVPELGRRVIGQDAALRTLARAVQRARTGLEDPRRPIGSFLFVGPTGVGKTEVARCLAEFLFDRPEAFLRFDMSEYMERHAVAKLIGAPPGYVGYEEGGRLTEAVRRRPASVVLFDEIEKAHPDLHNLLLQILEEGVLEDSHGVRVDFRHTVVLLTSNVGGRVTTEGPPIGFAEETLALREGRLTNSLRAEVKRGFVPELLSRLDEVIVFRALGPPDFEAIFELALSDLAARTARRRLSLEVSPAARAHLLAQATADPAAGARLVRRTAERAIGDALATALLAEGRRGPLAARVDLVEGTLIASLAQARRSPRQASGAINRAATETPAP